MSVFLMHPDYSKLEFEKNIKRRGEAAEEFAKTVFSQFFPNIQRTHKIHCMDLYDPILKVRIEVKYEEKFSKNDIEKFYRDISLNSDDNLYILINLKQCKDVKTKFNFPNRYLILNVEDATEDYLIMLKESLEHSNEPIKVNVKSEPKILQILKEQIKPLVKAELIKEIKIECNMAPDPCKEFVDQYKTKFEEGWKASECKNKYNELNDTKLSIKKMNKMLSKFKITNSHKYYRFYKRVYKKAKETSNEVLHVKPYHFHGNDKNEGITINPEDLFDIMRQWYEPYKMRPIENDIINTNGNELELIN